MFYYSVLLIHYLLKHNILLMLHKTKIKAPSLEKRKDPLQNEKFGYCYMICMTVANYGNTMLTSERKVQGHTTRSNSEFNTVLKR